MNEETTLDTGSQEVSEPAVIATAAAEPVAQQEVAQPVSEGNWLDGLDEAYRQNPLINKWGSLNDFAKTHLNAQKLIGADKVAIPGKAATDEEWQSLYQRLGAPEDPNQYEVEQTDVFDEASFTAFRNKAYEIGLSNKQAQEIAGLYQDQIATGREALNQRAEEARFSGEQELRKEFGQNFEQRLTQAQAAARTVMGDTEIFDEIKLADGRSLGDHPAIIRTFSRMAEMLGEDGLVGEPTDVVMSSQDAKQLISEHMRPNTPYTIAGHPEHDMAVAEVLRLRGYV
jgi:hypothetical protein|tara:strand:+ start:975 stop:1829 length:855 start_codon:yes stop_codon:yes gene_type:complete